MTNTAFQFAARLDARRRVLGMSHPTLAARSGVSETTVKRILGDGLAEASFTNVCAVAFALGVSMDLQEISVDEIRKEQAARKAKMAARMVQGTSALESQAVDAATLEQLTERSFHELLAGSKRRLWAE